MSKKELLAKLKTLHTKKKLTYRYMSLITGFSERTILRWIRGDAMMSDMAEQILKDKIEELNQID
jgi:hypothetical protein